MSFLITFIFSGELGKMWERPKNIPYPNIWHEFEARDNSSDKIIKYRIQDLPENRFQDGIEHLLNYYANEEQIIKSHGMIFSLSLKS